MSDRYIVDTNILMYAQRHFHGREARTRKALVEPSGVIGRVLRRTQVLQELCVNLRRKAGQPDGRQDSASNRG